MRTSTKRVTQERTELSSSAWLGFLISGITGWIRDYMRLAARGDCIDRVVGRYLIPFFVCLVVYFFGKYFVCAVSQQLEKEPDYEEQQSYMEKKFTDNYFITSIAAQNNSIRPNVTG